MIARRLLLLALLASLAALAPAQDKKPDDKKPDTPKIKTLGTIERHDPAFDKLIAKDAVLEVLTEGHDWVEGPVWIPGDKGGYLLYSDIPRNSIYQWTPGAKEALLFYKPSGYQGTRTDFVEPGSNGLILEPKGARIILCEHGDRQVSAVDLANRNKVVLVHKTPDGKRLNSPNDGTYKSNGDLYFTDPPYGRMVKDKPGEFPDRDLDYCGVWRLTTKGELTLLTKEMTKPNGICFSPDEKTLYVANSDPKLAIWKAFPVKADGTLGEGKVFFDSTKDVGKLKGLPDGMKVDKAGYLFATGPGGVLIFAPDGKHLGTLATGVPTSNCGWGPDGYLYVTADKAVCRIKTLTGPK